MGQSGRIMLRTMKSSNYKTYIFEQLLRESGINYYLCLTIIYFTVSKISEKIFTFGLSKGALAP